MYVCVHAHMFPKSRQPVSKIYLEMQRSFVHKEQNEKFNTPDFKTYKAIEIKTVQF